MCVCVCVCVCVRVPLNKKAEFSPWGPEPNWCYVTDPSHPDVESPESLQAATQARPVSMEHAIISAARLQITSSGSFWEKNGLRS